MTGETQNWLEDPNLDFLIDQEEETDSGGCYKVLIADDDEAIHQVTQITLNDFEFNGKKLQFFHAYSGQETIRFFQEHTDVAIVFLDVVMEEEDSGLQAVEQIRNVLKNRNVRIVLRTGQPGVAPEKDIIKNYDINDYKTKTEMTYEKLYSTVYTCLRSYRDIITIEKNKAGLEKIVRASSTIFKKNSFDDFLIGILEQLSSLCDDENILIFKDSLQPSTENREPKNTFIAQSKDKAYRIVAATGRFSNFIKADVREIPELQPIYDVIRNIDHKTQDNFLMLPDKSCLAYHKGSGGTESYIYLESTAAQEEFQLIKAFLSNFSIAIDNYQLTQEMMDIQKEVIWVLGELIEKRSEETAFHVRRISEITYLLAKAAGASEELCDNLRIASSLHDVGKISIPDSILKKPGRLDDQEYAVMKTHSMTGYSLLRSSSQAILRLSAEIAKSHHEKFDGSGYPEGLRGDEIPFSARIVAIADVYDALSHKRCYKPEWSQEKVMAYFQENRGKHFDPGLTDLFFQILDQVQDLNRLYP